MGAKRIPAEAFEDFYALGSTRSYAALAEKYKVSKQAIARVAKAEHWVQRVAERDAKVRTAVADKVEESVADLRARHAKVLKVMTAKALEALKKLPLTSGMDGIRALDLVLKQERLLHGEPIAHAVVETPQKPVGPPIPKGKSLTEYFVKLQEAAIQHGLLKLDAPIRINVEDEPWPKPEGVLD